MIPETAKPKATGSESSEAIEKFRRWSRPGALIEFHRNDSSGLFFGQGRENRELLFQQIKAIYIHSKLRISDSDPTGWIISAEQGVSEFTASWRRNQRVGDAPDQRASKVEGLLGS